MTPEELLAEADRVLRTVVPGTGGCWPRACVWLTRLTLEEGLDRYWAAVQPEVAACAMRPQLLLLPRYGGADLAQRTRQAWTNLSRAAHHHAYESAPTAAELRRWHDLVAAVLADLARTTQSYTAGTSTGGA
jgi:hypothetical protein